MKRHASKSAHSAASGSGGRWALLAVAALLGATLTPSSLHAQTQDGTGRKSFRAGVLELAGTTALSVSYQKERETSREVTNLRITPSIGYFILDRWEVALQLSYILDNIHISAGNDDRSQRLLFGIGPVYNLEGLSDLFVPYGGLLFGMYYQSFKTQTTTGSGESRSDLQLALGMSAGIRWMLTENVGLKTGFQYVHGFAEEYIGHSDFFGLELGVSLFIPTWPAF